MTRIINLAAACLLCMIATASRAQTSGGVVHPPAGIDPGMAKTPPATKHIMPVVRLPLRDRHHGIKTPVVPR